MMSQLAKIFKIVSKDGTKIVYFNYSPSKDEYYSFIKKHFDNGFRQVIITSEIMIEITKEYFLNRNFMIKDIEFMVDDECLESEIRFILERLNTDRAYLGQLIDKLKFLIEEESIDIKKIELEGKTENNTSLFLFFQVNGIFGITDSSFDTESTKLLEKIEGYLIK